MPRPPTTDRPDPLPVLLHDEIHRGGARPEVIDRLLAERRPDVTDEGVVAELLLLLSDEVEHDDGMWSLIHAAETAEDPIYVAAVVRAYPVLSHQAPGWAGIVLRRILNHPAAEEHLLARIGARSTPSSASVHSALLGD